MTRNGLLDGLDARHRRLLERCGELAAERGEAAWLVGGTVRDLLLGRPATDLDVVVEGDGMALAQALARDQEGRLTRHHAFQTARVDIPPPEHEESELGGGRVDETEGGEGRKDAGDTSRHIDGPADESPDDRSEPGAEGAPAGPPATASVSETPEGWVRVDVATARREEYPSPGELPRVVPGSLRDDLERRDFTINTLAVALDPERFGELVDPFDGVEALEAGRVEVLHPRSFADDPTRVLRALRFAERFGYRLEERTAGWLAEAVDGGYLDRVSGARVRRELRYLLEEEPVDGPVGLERHGVLEALQPGLEARPAVLEALEDARRWFREACGPEGDEIAAPGWGLVLAACGRPLASQARWSLVRRLALTREERGPLLETGVAWREARRGWREAGEDEARPSRLEERLRPLSTGTLVVAIAFLEAEGETQAGDEVRWYLTDLRHVRPALDGADLLSIGVREGPRVGEMLERLRAARLDGQVESRADEERRVREWLDEPAS